jgi:hypothetical protein
LARGGVPQSRDESRPKTSVGLEAMPQAPHACSRALRHEATCKGKDRPSREAAGRSTEHLPVNLALVRACFAKFDLHPGQDGGKCSFRDDPKGSRHLDNTQQHWTLSTQWYGDGLAVLLAHRIEREAVGCGYLNDTRKPFRKVLEVRCVVERHISWARDERGCVGKQVHVALHKMARC